MDLEDVQKVLERHNTHITVYAFGAHRSAQYWKGHGWYLTETGNKRQDNTYIMDMEATFQAAMRWLAEFDEDRWAKPIRLEEKHNG